MSLRSPALMMLPVALLAAGCDRQSPGTAQPQSDADLAAAASPEPGAEKKGFNGTLDIASRGSAMPAFTFLNPAGQKLSSADLAGKPVLINLWATWCGPCVLEMPMLDSLAEKYRGKLTVLTIAEDMQQEKVARFYADQQFRHLQPWLDTDMQLSDHYNTGVLPTTVLYDSKGKEVWRMVGAHDWNSPRTSALLADTLGQ